jgi:orotate phosphoribosyltransferase
MLEFADGWSSPMNYRSVASLDRLVLEWLCRLPRDLDVIVGVPRSGMLVANLLALHLNLPMTDVEGLLHSRLISFSGRTKPIDLRKPRKVLVVDDALSTGRQLEQVRKRIAEAGLAHEILYAAAYVRPGAEARVDFYGEHLDDPQLFEWNVMHHPVLLGSCLDIDGVLCADTDAETDVDEQRYCRFLEQAAPMVIPTMPIGWLVTARLEKYRRQTEQWLLKHGVHYRELIMWDLADHAARSHGMSHGEYKAGVYRATNADLFIESSAGQAVEIADLSGRRVLCMATREMVVPAARAGITDRAPTTPGAAQAVAAHNPLLRAGATWEARVQAAMIEILRIVPPGAAAIVIDDWQWGLASTFAGRRIIRFVERDGQYLGPPAADDARAIADFEHLREQDVAYAVLGWPCFWWLESYPRFFQHVRERYSRIFESDQMSVFDLTANPSA